VAVYTQVSSEELSTLLARYDAGELRSSKGIAEGVENSNYLVDTDNSRYILTLYEKRVDAGDLPFFMALLDHLADDGLPVPRAITDRHGVQIQTVAGRPACLIEFLTGVSLSHPTIAQTRAAGVALGQMHRSLQTFALERPNTMGPKGWEMLADQCGADLDRIKPGLATRIEDEIAFIGQHWPDHLPRSVIHADLFPDNVLMQGDRVTGLIDFYFACSEIRAWDVAVTHAAWCFESDGTGFDAGRSAALFAGYAESFGLSDEERVHFLTLARGAALRFTLTRAYDWINTPADALVTRKDPDAFLRRLEFYADATLADLGL
jgi:homoserine kinase type II